MKPKVKITIIEARQLQELCDVFVKNEDSKYVKIGVGELKKLDEINKEVNHKSWSYNGFLNLSKDNIKTLKKFLDNRTWFEKIYDRISFWLCNGKSFAPNELKTFR